MDPILQQKITVKLRDYLKREPSEAEIINGQNDSNLMHWIAQDDAALQKEQIATIAVAANVDISKVKTKKDASIGV